MPTSYMGLIGLLIITVAHVVTTFIMMVMYLASANGSRLESAFLSVAQFAGYTPDGSSDGLEIWLKRARAGWTDEEI